MLFKKTIKLEILLKSLLALLSLIYL